MSPECLDPSSKRPFYYCAPNDVWSLGVVLVNLTCGRNPWKQASQDDHTYQAFIRKPGFLKSILPLLSDELNDILGLIFTPNPDTRITLSELKARILACSRFTEAPTMALPTPPASPEHTTIEYVQQTCEEAAIDYGYAPLSPAVSDDDSSSDGESTCSEGSLTSSLSSIGDDEMYQDIHIREVMTPPPQPEGPVQVAICDHEEAMGANFQPEFVPYTQCVMPDPVLQHPIPMALPPQVNCGAKYSYFPNVWDWMGKYAHAVPQHQAAFHQQVPPMFALHGF